MFTGAVAEDADANSRLTAWIFDDPEGYRQQVLVNMGYRVLRSSDVFTLTNGERLSASAEALKRRRPTVLWINLFRSGTPRGNRRDRKAAEVIVRMVREFLCGTGVLIIEASATSPTWELVTLTELWQQEELKSSLQRWCNHGVQHAANGRPSSALSRIISNISVIEC